MDDLIKFAETSPCTWSDLGNQYLKSYAVGPGGAGKQFKTPREAKGACDANPDCSGITCVHDNYCSLRSGTSHPSPTVENSYECKRGSVVGGYAWVSLEGTKFTDYASGDGGNGQGHSLPDAKVKCAADSTCAGVTCPEDNSPWMPEARCKTMSGFRKLSPGWYTEEKTNWHPGDWHPPR